MSKYNEGAKIYEANSKTTGRKIYVCCITRGHYDAAYVYLVTAFSDEQKAKQWVDRKEEGYNKLWKLQKDCVAKYPYVAHVFEHNNPPSNKGQIQALQQDYYPIRSTILKEYGISEDEHGPYYEEVELVE